MKTFPSVSYQIYPRSFAVVGEGHSMGNLAGITTKLDHLVDIGVEMFWISPIYPSPDYDQGYDVTDHTAVDPRLGTLTEFDALVVAAHERNLKILIDFIPNHVSTLHPWFVASLDPASPYRRWFYWREPKPDGTPFNNYTSPLLPNADETPRSAWVDDPSGTTKEQYLSLFFPEQADLDWNNPEVIDAQLDVMRFWLARGVDGFRIDVAHTIGKPLGLPDHPLVAGDPHSDVVHSLHHPEVANKHFERMREVCNSFGDDRILIGEICIFDAQKQAEYLGSNLLDSALMFSLQDTGWSAAKLRSTLEDAKTHMLDFGKMPTWMVDSHDVPRLSARVGSEARALAMYVFMLGLPGNVIVYQGDEFMTPELAIPEGHVGDWRGGSRARITWTADLDGGWLTSAETDYWIPLAPEGKSHNPETQREQPASALSTFKHSIALRKTLNATNYDLIDTDVDVVCYRINSTFVLINCGSSDAKFPEGNALVVIASNDNSLINSSFTGTIPPDTTVILSATIL